ncbi:hypothetical protein SBA3_5050008 [Candidatus Sulfopaludibacter sp. SbA3]|nr:hypothetical protein SBA3_5050008 [Candidatus Sulfopaludibacter sp. SbA3]
MPSIVVGICELFRENPFPPRIVQTRAAVAARATNFLDLTRSARRTCLGMPPSDLYRPLVRLQRFAN